MKPLFAFGLVLVFGMSDGHAGEASWLLHYDEPARQWVEALPVGNGRMGAMVFGGTGEERLQLNEQNVWTGGPHNYAHPKAYQSLPEIRRLLFAGKHVGIRARDGFEMDLAWQNSKLTHVVVRSHQGKPAVIAYGDQRYSLPSRVGEIVR